MVQTSNVHSLTALKRHKSNGNIPYYSLFHPIVILIGTLSVDSLCTVFIVISLFDNIPALWGLSSIYSHQGAGGQYTGPVNLLHQVTGAKETIWWLICHMYFL